LNHTRIERKKERKKERKETIVRLSAKIGWNFQIIESKKNRHEFFQGKGNDRSNRLQRKKEKNKILILEKK